MTSFKHIFVFVSLITAITGLNSLKQDIYKVSGDDGELLMQKLHLLQNTLLAGHGFNAMEFSPEALEDIKYLIAPGLVSKNEQCRRQSEMLIEDRSLAWTTKMLDSSGLFPPSGVYYGNLQSIGQFDECLDITADVSAPWDEPEILTGKHCVTYFTTANATSPPKIHRGVCVPSSCSYEDVQNGTNMFLRHLHMFTRLGELSCSVKEKATFSTADIAVICLISTISLLVVLGTIGDVILTHKLSRNKNDKAVEAGEIQNKPPGVGVKIIQSLSLVANTRKMFTVKKGELDVMHGMRFLSMTWVILGHSYVMAVSLPVQNYVFFLQASSQWILQMVFNAFVSVDSFFFMSGFLVSYVFYRATRKPRNGFLMIPLILKGYLYRYLRLTPVYGIVIAIAATIYTHFGSGPYWKPITNTLVGVCQENWWTNILYVNNFVVEDGGRWCIGQSWYLAVDMQFFLIAPIITVPLLYRRKLGLLWAAFLTIWSIIIPAVTIYKNDFPPGVPVMGIDGSADPDFMEHFYNMPWDRASPYFIGLIAGYLYVKKPKRQLLNLPIALVGWFFATGVGITVVFGMYNNLQLGATYSMGVATMYGSLHRVAWSLCLAWIVFASTQGYGGPVKTFLGWSAWVPLSRMSYCSYLLALHVQCWFIATRVTPLYYDHPLLMFCFFGYVILTHLLALLFSLVFESPCVGLTKILLEGSRRPRAPASTQADKQNEKDKKIQDVSAIEKQLENGDAQRINSRNNNVEYHEDINGKTNEGMTSKNVPRISGKENGGFVEDEKELHQRTRAIS